MKRKNRLEKFKNSKQKPKKSEFLFRMKTKNIRNRKHSNVYLHQMAISTLEVDYCRFCRFESFRIVRMCFEFDFGQKKFQFFFFTRIYVKLWWQQQQKVIIFFLMMIFHAAMTTIIIII